MSAAYTDKWKLRPEQELLITLEDLDFSWYLDEVTLVKKLWLCGCHLADIAKKVRRDPDEVAILIMHLARQGEISKREGGAFGRAATKKLSKF